MITKFRNPLLAVGLHVTLLSRVRNTPQLPLSCELLVQHFELVDELLAYGSKDVSGRDGPVCLDTDEQLGDVRMPDCTAALSAGLSPSYAADIQLTLVASHVDVGVSLEMLGEQVSQGVILFPQDKV